jgi:hypothetical protein
MTVRSSQVTPYPDDLLNQGVKGAKSGAVVTVRQMQDVFTIECRSRNHSDPLFLKLDFNLFVQVIEGVVFHARSSEAETAVEGLRKGETH